MKYFVLENLFEVANCACLMGTCVYDISWGKLRVNIVGEYSHKEPN